MKFSYASLTRFFCSRAFIDYGDNPSTSVVVAGHARSGTTWIANIINHRNEYRLIFEPFFAKKVPECLHFGRKRYIRPTMQDSSLQQPVDDILRGKIRNRWTDSHNRRCISRKRLIKTIRANLFLKWLHVHFPDVPIILVMRHPCPVISSAMRQGWNSALPVMMRQQALVDDFLTPFSDAIHGARDNFERYVFSWCIEHYVIFRQFQPGEMYPLFYENLYQQPEEQILRLFTYLGSPYKLKKMMKIFQNPSLTTKRNRQEVTERRPIDDWRQYLTKKQIHRCVDILSIFGLDRVYTDSFWPDESGVLEVMSYNDSNT